MFKVLTASVKAIIKELVEISYFMKGGITYDSLFFKTPGEREIMTETIMENIKLEAGVKTLTK